MSTKYTLSEVFSQSLSSLEELFNENNYRKLDETDWDTLDIGPFTDVGSTVAIRKINTFVLHILTELKKECGSTWHLSLSDPFVDNTGAFIANGWIDDITSDFGKVMKTIVQTNHSSAIDVVVSNTISHTRLLPLGELTKGKYYYAFTYDEDDIINHTEELLGRVVIGHQSTVTDLLSASGSGLTAIPVSHVPELTEQFCVDFVELVAVSILKKQEFGSSGSFYTDNTTSISVIPDLTGAGFELGESEVTFDECEDGSQICIDVPTYSFQQYVSIPSAYVRNISAVTAAVQPLTSGDVAPFTEDEVSAQRTNETEQTSTVQNTSSGNGWIWALVIGIIVVIIVLFVAGGIGFYYMMRKPSMRPNFEQRYDPYTRY